MKLLNIDQGIARLTEGGDVGLLDTPYTEIGQSISEGALETLRSAGVKSTHALIDPFLQVYFGICRLILDLPFAFSP